MNFSLNAITPGIHAKGTGTRPSDDPGRRAGGLSAAVYAARAELAPVVLTGISFGGQAALTNTIENYPGFPDGVGGAQLGDLIKAQAERFGASIVYDTAIRVDLSHRPFSVKTYSKEYLADA